MGCSLYLFNYSDAMNAQSKHSHFLNASQLCKSIDLWLDARGPATKGSPNVFSVTFSETCVNIFQTLVLHSREQRGLERHLNRLLVLLKSTKILIRDEVKECDIVVISNLPPKRLQRKPVFLQRSTSTENRSTKSLERKEMVKKNTA